MATAYTGTVIAALGTPNGARKMFYYTASDVAGEFWLAASGASELVLHGGQDVFIIDVVPSSSAGTTKNVEFFLSGSSTGIIQPLANLVGTIYQRPFTLAPLRVPAGTMFKIIQRA